MTPEPSPLITIPPALHPMPLHQIGIGPLTYARLARAGLHTLGDLHGLSVASLSSIRDFGLRHRRDLTACLDRLLLPPPSSPEAMLQWLLEATRNRQLLFALRHPAEGVTLRAIAEDEGRSPERVRQLVVVGRMKAKRLLPQLEAWPALERGVREALAALQVATEPGMYALLAEEHGWRQPPSLEAMAALRGLLSLSGAAQVRRHGPMVYYLLDEREARSRLRLLEAADEAGLEAIREALPAQARGLFEHDRVALWELGGGG
ncbi:MAG: hypothetical protein ACLGIN_02405 [Candidatus Sericytochromatia bacterium]